MSKQIEQVQNLITKSAEASSHEAAINFARAAHHCAESLLILEHADVSSSELHGEPEPDPATPEKEPETQDENKTEPEKEAN